MKLGDAPAIYVGPKSCQAVYRGSTKLWTPPAPAANVKIVQMASASTLTGSAASTRTVTLANAPTPGNHLLGLLGYYQIPSGATSSAPDGSWVVWTAGELRGVNAFIHSIVSGDGKTYTFTLSTARNFGVILYEISGSNGVMYPVGVTSIASGAAATISTPADAGGSLVIGLLKQLSQPAGGSTATAEWAKDIYIAQSNGSLTAWHTTSVANVSPVLTATGSTAGGVMGMLSLAPR